ncbi:MAG: hypothetical protein IJX89_01890 [Alphaproteobacteria bacterium]|nr:hypothetical protein [Alphaproteobacteria bacterium]
MGQLVSDITSVLDYKDAKKSAKTTRQEILAQMAADEATKTNLVKKTLAAQRAKYGASGMSAAGMTEGAVLKRLKSETEQPYDEKRKNNLAKLKSARATKPNLLKNWLSRFDSIVG